MADHVDIVTKRGAERLPKGNYALVSMDVDTTGRRLIDEIVQLAAYTPNDQYGQYIMPIMNLNPAARQRHQIRVITVGFFRMLKSMQTYKVVKTKHEVAALNDFLTWLEKTNAATKDSQGVIIIYHEQRKFIPYILLEAMNKYGLLARFFSTVKAFADGFSLAEATLGNTIKYFTLKQLAKVILQHEEVTEKDRYDFEGNASVRARLAYQIIEKVALKGDGDGTEEAEAAADDGLSAEEKMLRLVCEHASPINEHVDALADQAKCMERQNSLRPIFVTYFKVTLYHRVKAVTFRRILAEHGYDIEMLREIWEAKKSEGLLESIASMEELKDEEKTELVEMLDHYFDPEKTVVQPLVKKNKPKRGGTKENVKPNGSGHGGNSGGSQRDPTSPDSMSKTPQKRSRRRRASSFSAKQHEANKAEAAKNGQSNSHANSNGHSADSNSANSNGGQHEKGASEKSAADSQKRHSFGKAADSLVNGIHAIDINAN